MQTSLSNSDPGLGSESSLSRVTDCRKRQEKPRKQNSVYTYVEDVDKQGNNLLFWTV